MIAEIEKLDRFVSDFVSDFVKEVKRRGDERRREVFARRVDLEKRISIVRNHLYRRPIEEVKEVLRVLNELERAVDSLADIAEGTEP